MHREPHPRILASPFKRANQIVWQAMTRFALTTASFTPALAGQVNIKVKAALATTTFYVDPQPVL